MSTDYHGKGGDGGDGKVIGDRSFAQGGAGGDAVVGAGGRGGNALVHGADSQGYGGKGGRGGVGPGQPGGDVEIRGDGQMSIGGQGGEANQADGRGGRGGRAGDLDHLRSYLTIPEHHMRPPYGELHAEPGRGGDGADSPQYMARRLIVEMLKNELVRASALSDRDLWYDRKIIPLEWINEKLAEYGHRWRAQLTDFEYEFEDVC